MKSIFWQLMFLILGFSARAQQPFFRELVIDRQDDDIKTNTVFQSPGGLIYLGTSKGLFRYDGFDFRNLSVENNRSDLQITAIAGPYKEGFCTGSEKGELLVWIADKPERIPAPFHSPVKSLFFDDNNVLWVMAVS